MIAELLIMALPKLDKPLPVLEVFALSTVLVSIKFPLLRTPPPPPLPKIRPCVIVRSLILTFEPLPILNTRCVLFPLIVNKLTPEPRIVSAPLFVINISEVVNIV